MPLMSSYGNHCAQMKPPIRLGFQIGVQTPQRATGCAKLFFALSSSLLSSELSSAVSVATYHLVQP